MVHTAEQEATVSASTEIERCLNGIDINNSCRQVYLRRMEYIEECKRTTNALHFKRASSIESALLKLRIGMVNLMDQDTGLMRQMLILNEKVEELKTNQIRQMSKESLVSQDSLLQEDGETDDYCIQSKDSLYHSDEQTDESLCGSKQNIYIMQKRSNSEFCRDSVDSLYQSDEYLSDEENNDRGSEKSVINKDTNIFVCCPNREVGDIASYDTLFEKLLDFDDKI